MQVSNYEKAKFREMFLRFSSADIHFSQGLETFYFCNLSTQHSIWHITDVQKYI